MDEPFGVQHDAVRRQFAVQASHWGADAIDDDLLWAASLLPLRPRDAALDVAAGSGLLARAIAPRVARVTAVDLTPEMLAEGRRSAARDGLGNVSFEEGTAEALPYPDGAFDAVVTRFSFHHFERPGAALSEMVRVCRPGGHVAVIDMVAPDDPALDARYNHFERLRDPSHTRALTRDGLRALFTAAGLAVAVDVARDVANELEPWLDRSRTPDAARREILAAITAELAGSTRTGMRPSRTEDGRLRFLHRWNVLIAPKV